MKYRLRIYNNTIENINDMQLKSLSYKEHVGTPILWELEEFILGKIGLFVAKNATGKSRTLNVINAFSLIWSKKMTFSNCSFSAVFMEGDDEYCYDVEFDLSTVKKELLTKNKITLIERDSEGLAKFLFKERKETITTKIPLKDLAVSRQDEIQHPYLIELTDWAENTFHYLFGSDMSKTTFTVMNKQDEKNASSKKEEEDAPTSEMFRRGQTLFGNKFINSIINDMQSINYQIEDILISDISNITSIQNIDLPGTPQCIFVKEEGIDTYIPQYNLSQGMFRALSLIINLNYLQYKELKGCILIDDIGEGLDFERSTALIKLIVDKAEESFAQLFMTTNDKFVMNVVPLDYWNVIVRNSQTCSILNSFNSKDIFDEFEFTGLNNFDFLSMDFYKRDMNL